MVNLLTGLAGKISESTKYLQIILVFTLVILKHSSGLNQPPTLYNKSFVNSNMVKWAFFSPFFSPYFLIESLRTGIVRSLFYIVI